MTYKLIETRPMERTLRTQRTTESRQSTYGPRSLLTPLVWPAEQKNVHDVDEDVIKAGEHDADA